ncbi:MAG: peptidase S9, partial [Gammaproteobacteria bacterium]|nr:peptidase S9 [Gammaproteobacteria bacterium]
MQPAFSPDGSMLAFVSDRGPETDFTDLVYSRPRIALLNMETREVRTLDLFDNVKHLNPQFTPDGQGLYFISDQDGFSDIYRVNLPTGEIYRVTNIATAVSGITSGSPAMSIASQTGTLVFSVFDEFEFHIYSLSSQEAGAAQELAREGTEVPEGRLIPPADPLVRSRVANYLADPLTGLPPTGTYVSE